MDFLDDMFFQKALIKKCTHELKWRNHKGEIISRWINFDDSYKLYDALKYYSNRTNIPGDTMVISLPYDEETINLRLGKRLLIDVDGIIDTPSAYKVSNRNVLSRQYGDKGIVRLTLSHDQFNFETDNIKLLIADYYTDLPVYEEKNNIDDIINPHIGFRGQARLVMGSPRKKFTLSFADQLGNIIEDVEPEWRVQILDEFEDLFEYDVKGNELNIKANYSENIIDYEFKIIGSDKKSGASTEITIKVVNNI